MTSYPIILTLPDQPPRQIAMVEAASDEALIARITERYPFLPPHHTLVGDRLLAGLLQPQTAMPVAALTEGQRIWRERKKAKGYAERWRQHWIDKDNAKRRA